MSDPRRDPQFPAASTDAGAPLGASSQVPAASQPPGSPGPLNEPAPVYGEGSATAWGAAAPAAAASTASAAGAASSFDPNALPHQAPLRSEEGLPPGSADRPTGPPDLGWLGNLKGLTGSLRGMVQGRLLLLSLELQRAQQGLMSLIVLLVVAAIAGATAWIALWAGLAALAVQFGLTWPWACAAVLGANLLLLLWMVAAMKSLMPLLSLPASRRQFHWLFNDPQDAPAPSDDGRTASTP